MKLPVKISRYAGLPGHTGAIYTLIGAGEKSFYSGSGDHVVAEWNFDDIQNGSLLARVPEIVYSLALDKERNLLFIGQAAGGIHVTDLNSKVEKTLLQYHEAAVFDIAISKKNELIISLAGNGKIAVSHLQNFTMLHNLNLSESKLRSASINSDETLLAVGVGDGSISIFSLPEMSKIKSWQAHQEKFSVNVVKFSPDGKYLLSGSRDAHLNVYDVQNNFSLIKSIAAHNYAIYSIVYSPDKLLFATGSRDKSIKIWDAETFEVLIKLDKENFNGHINSVNKLLWHVGSGMLISGSDDRSVIVWEIKFESMNV